ncbi:MAG: major capsid protein [Candidatus Pacebacteria bacterium]|nr:major capsid protein [Candidatus Paceibacterota bacterium]
MPATRIADVVVPSVFNPYVVERTAELSALVQSGIVKADPAFDVLASKGGRILNMPYWNDLTGADEVLSDANPLQVENITANQDIAALLMRGKAWGVNDLAKALSGDDPMRAIGDLVAGYWSRRMQDTLISTLGGVFLAANMAGNELDITAIAAPGNVINASTFADAQQLLGDAKDRLVGVMMHSATETSLIKQGLISNELESINGESIRVKRFNGKRVIVDDRCPNVAGAYTTYLFGEGAIAYGNGQPPVPTEFGRNVLQGDDILVNRKHFILHPRGVAFQDAAVVGSSPTNAELANGANWSRVYENKNIRIVSFTHNLA